ncbi:hypothetical protein HYH03_007104 [Edaphochlamys debaryana]|uniref:F5/8 type C domain-containing protein n=1 Tax=Edaphochlamys debaryana TaxID=47281 RepID=A0A835Y462_9CHLO|nr:hypothetical protein HYH03_007104 [Edaphochlamys debaryana]|eukprot:KAG2494864.1 hypothetical protein HYH03_007104 [Edaphochlamys debaryana]
MAANVEPKLSTADSTYIPANPRASLFTPLVIDPTQKCSVSQPPTFSDCKSRKRCGLYQRCYTYSGMQQGYNAVVIARNRTGWLVLTQSGDLQLYAVRPAYMPPVPELGWGRVVKAWATNTNLTGASRFAFVLVNDGTWQLYGAGMGVPFGVRATSAGSFFGMEGGSNSHTYPQNAGEANAPFKLRVFDFGVHRFGWSYAVIENKDRRPAWSTLDVNPCTNQAPCPGKPMALCRPSADWTKQDCTACKPPFYKTITGKCMGYNVALNRPTVLGNGLIADQSTSPGAAVDGRDTTVFVGKAIFIGSPTPYWQVNLDQPTKIMHLELHGSFDYNNVDVSLSGTSYQPNPDYNYPPSTYEHRTLDLNPPVTASYVRVYAQKAPTNPGVPYPVPMKLTLVEVAVYTGRD